MEKLSIFKTEDPEEFNKIIEIRKAVFVKEQNVPEELEIDGLDNEAEHFIMYLGEKPIGCARIRKNKYAKLERIAVLKEYRGKGYGKKLTQYLIDYCKEQNFKKIVIHSQIYVIDFYKKFGFEPVGKVFFEAGIKHRKMVLKLS